MKGRNRQFNNPEEMERQLREERENWRVSLLEGDGSHKIKKKYEGEGETGNSTTLRRWKGSS